MSTDKVSLPLKAPLAGIKDWQVDFRELLKGLAKATTHAMMIKAGVEAHPDLAADLVELANAVKREPEPAQLAWLLIRRGLARAILDLFDEARHLLPRETPPSFMDAHLDLAIEQAELSIDPTFFDRPAQLPLLDFVRIPLQHWLGHAGLTGTQAQRISERLPAYFAYGLHQEWRKNGRDYERLQAALETPFAQVAEREAAWASYAVWLQRRVHSSMFGESFGLMQVYVPLRAYYERNDAHGGRLNELPSGEGRGERLLPVVVDLMSEVVAWIDRADKDDALRILSGGPGSGKSSFSQVLAAEMSQRSGLRVVHVALHHLDPKRDLIEAVGECLTQAGLLPFNPLADVKDPRVLLLLDGLDELAMQGRGAAEVAGQFILEVLSTLHRHNQLQLQLQALLCGREVVVQSNAHYLRKPRQILHVLPFRVEPGKGRGIPAFSDKDKLLAHDQRDLWWRRYGAISGLGYSGLPVDLRRADLDEITAQPLLNYLVALSLARGQLDFSNPVNRKASPPPVV